MICHERASISPAPLIFAAAVDADDALFFFSITPFSFVFLHRFSDFLMFCHAPLFFDILRCPAAAATPLIDADGAATPILLPAAAALMPPPL